MLCVNEVEACALAGTETFEADAVLTLLHEKYPQPHPDSRLTPEHPDAQIIDGVLPAYDVPESALSDYLRPDWSDACINVRTEKAYETAHEVLRAEGLFLDTSAAAALHAAVQVGRRPENQEKNIVVIVPDNGMKYLSTPMYRQK